VRLCSAVAARNPAGPVAHRPCWPGLDGRAAGRAPARSPAVL